MNIAEHRSVEPATRELPVGTKAEPVSPFAEGPSSDAVSNPDRNEKPLLERLADSESYLKTLMETLPVGVIVVDPASHTIVEANRFAGGTFRTGAPAKLWATCAMVSSARPRWADVRLPTWGIPWINQKGSSWPRVE